MTRRMRLFPTEAATTAAGRFVRDMCRNWGIQDNLLGESAAVVRRLVGGVTYRTGAVFELVLEARRHSVIVRVRDSELAHSTPAVPDWRTDPSRDHGAGSRPAGTWEFGSSGDGTETWAMVPRAWPPSGTGTR